MFHQFYDGLTLQFTATGTGKGNGIPVAMF